jgi:hypothetical protein
MAMICTSPTPNQKKMTAQAQRNISPCQAKNGGESPTGGSKSVTPTKARRGTEKWAARAQQNFPPATAQHWGKWQLPATSQSQAL